MRRSWRNEINGCTTPSPQRKQGYLRGPLACASGSEPFKNDMPGTIDIVIGDVTDMEAHVFAKYAADRRDQIELVGTLRGPFCAGVRTLAADFEFQPAKSDDPCVALAEAVVTDPCMWSAEMPHVYDVNVTVRVGEQVLAEHRGKIGLRRLAPRRPVDFAPGTG